MKGIILLIAFITLFTVVHSANVSFEKCRKINLMEITEMNAMPWPPRSGLDTMYLFKTYLGKNVTSLMMNLNFQMRVGINQWETVVDETVDLCDGFVQCPLNAGEYEIPFIHSIPSNSPVGYKWRGYVYFRNEKNVELGCIELESFKVK